MWCLNPGVACSSRVTPLSSSCRDCQSFLVMLLEPFSPPLTCFHFLFVLFFEGGGRGVIISWRRSLVSNFPAHPFLLHSMLMNFSRAEGFHLCPLNLQTTGPKTTQLLASPISQPPAGVAWGRGGGGGRIGGGGARRSLRSLRQAVVLRTSHTCL
uniref:Uncharacterized protein n=1 Tax=Pipistrellus kuhlii TaxID=59472 RepID=A0A7J7TXF1_PIPKU|nr:hypothetical protein mPipKuh1_009210 [Pipistrellus kuhlii]